MNLSDIPNEVLDYITPYAQQGADAFFDLAPHIELADLEISLHRRTGSSYSVETRFTPPGSKSEIRFGASTPVAVNFDLGALQEYMVAGDWNGYGGHLSQTLFSPEPIKMALGQSLARAGTGSLRLRLLFGPTAQELHGIYWETLRNPLDGTLLSANQKILFSRYLAGNTYREVKSRSRSAVRALVAAANPSGLDQYGLALVDVPGELNRAQMGMGGFQVEALPSETEGCTLEGIVRHLQTGFDILYLVAHGSLVKDQAWLWLENENQEVQRVSGEELAGQIRLLDRPPLLVVFASCESAGKGEGDALQALGPLMSEAGVPAVIAMQGKITMESVRRGMPVFFETLQRNGQVDLALASARSALAAAGARDLWMPALFMRLKDGYIWQPADQTLPDHLKKLWALITDRFQGKPAAEGAMQDYLDAADDPDNQAAFRIQLKKALKEDEGFARELVAVVEVTRKKEQGGQPGGVSIQVGGNVGGSIVLGNSNIVGDFTDTE